MPMRPTTARRLGLLVLLAVPLGPPANARADDPPPTGVAAESPDGEGVPTDEDERRALVVQTLLWILLGIALLGGVVMVGILLYGGHARRMARTPLPNQSAEDPFWYLRKGDAEDVPPTKADESPDETTPEDRP